VPFDCTNNQESTSYHNAVEDPSCGGRIVLVLESRKEDLVPESRKEDLVKYILSSQVKNLHSSSKQGCIMQIMLQHTEGPISGNIPNAVIFEVKVETCRGSLDL